MVGMALLTDLIIESAIREREEIQSGDEQEQFICMADMEIQIFCLLICF